MRTGDSASGGSAPRRFASVDALRGITVAAMLLVNTPGDWSHVYAPLRHAEWHGCTPTDLIFPMFLFIVGVSVALGLASQREAGADVPALQRAAWTRAARIVALGLLLNLLAWWLLERAAFRPWGVLQRIGLCFAVVAMFALHTRAAVQWLAIAGLLLGYGVMMAVTGGYGEWTNLASRVDTALLGPMNYLFDPATGRGHDPEGLLSTLPAIATTLLGLRAGDWLRNGRGSRLWLAAPALLLAGAALAPVVPFNKNLWTPSYVLWSGGWSMLALALCHALIDLRGWPALGRRFGVNAITAYAGSGALTILLLAAGWMEPLYRRGFARWMTPLWGPYLPSLAFALAFVALWWAVVYVMDRRGLRVRI